MDDDSRNRIPHKSTFFAIQIWLRNGRREGECVLKKYLLVRLAEVLKFGKMGIIIQNMVLLNVTYVQNVVESLGKECYTMNILPFFSLSLLR
jgi:hypothetical protein